MINIGIGLSWAAEKVFSAATSIINAFKTRVLAIPAVFENGSFLNLELNWLSKINLLDNASLILTPNSYIANKIYSVIPNTTLGDFDSTRATIATRVNSSGLIEIVDTGIPRIDYSSGIGVLLLEPQRTNLLLNSVWDSVGITPTSWSVIGGGVSSGVTSIKNPNATAYNFVSTSVDRRYFYQIQPFTINTITSLSVYVEQALVPTQAQSILSVINATGTSTFLKNNISINASEVIQEGNTYTLVFTATATTTGSEVRIGIHNSGIIGNVTLSMPQLETGAYATSYIPTTTSTVTRVADTMSRNNIYTNGLITSAGGTWFLELNNNVLLVRDGFSYGIFINSSSTANGNGFNIRHSTTNLLERLRINKTTLGIDTALCTTLTNNIKVAIKWNETTADVFVNGIKVVSATAFTTTNMEFLNGTAQEVPKYIKSMILFPTPLTDAEMASLTTL